MCGREVVLIFSEMLSSRESDIIWWSEWGTIEFSKFIHGDFPHVGGNCLEIWRKGIKKATLVRVLLLERTQCDGVFVCWLIQLWAIVALAPESIPHNIYTKNKELLRNGNQLQMRFTPYRCYATETWQLWPPPVCDTPILGYRRATLIGAVRTILPRNRAGSELANEQLWSYCRWVKRKQRRR